MNTATFGTKAVDWESAIQFDRLRRERVPRLRAELEKSELGALLAFDFSNIRYMSATHIGTWAMDKLIRFALLTRNSDPIVWDFGSAAKHHQLLQPVAGDDHRRGGRRPARAAPRRRPAAARGRRAGRDLHPARRVPPRRRRSPTEVAAQDQARTGEVRPARRAARRRRHRAAGAVRAAAGRHHRRRRPAGLPGGPPDQDPGRDHAAHPGRLDGRRRLRRALPVPAPRRAGERDASAWSPRSSYDLGSEYVEGVNAISGERCSPHPHVYSDRIIRPGDPAFFDILHSYNGYRTCYYRTFAVGSASRAQHDAYTRAREYMDRAIALVRPGATTADIVAVWPTAQEFGFPDEEAAFALQYGHGVGLSIWEKPIFSRLVSLEHPGGARGGHGLRARRPTGRRPTASALPASRRSSWSPPTAAR